MRSEKGVNRRVARAANLAAVILKNTENKRWGHFSAVELQTVRELTNMAPTVADAESRHGDKRATGDALNLLGIKQHDGMIAINTNTINKCKEFLMLHPHPDERRKAVKEAIKL